MRKILSFVLAICMVANFFVAVIPQEAHAAGTSAFITDAQSLEAALGDSTKTELVLSGTLYLDKTITIPSKRAITIRAEDGTRAFIQPSSEAWVAGTSLFKISAGADVTLQNITISGSYSASNPQKLAQGITVEIGGATVALSSVSIFNCDGGTKSGAGLSVGGAYPGNRGELILDGCVFWNNVTSLSTATCGGAIYCHPPTCNFLPAPV